MAYYNKKFSFLSVLVPSPLSINNSNLLPIFQGMNFLPEKCFVLLKYLKSNLVLSPFQYVNLLSGRIKWLLKIKVYITTETNIEISQISLSSMINDILFSICQKRSWTYIRLATSEENLNKGQQPSSRTVRAPSNWERKAADAPSFTALGKPCCGYKQASPRELGETSTTDLGLFCLRSLVQSSFYPLTSPQWVTDQSRWKNLINRVPLEGFRTQVLLLCTFNY